MLNNASFKVLNCIRAAIRPTQRLISEETGLSLGLVNSTLKDLVEAQLVDEENAITDRGVAALAPYKVDNAIIMAAGMSSRFAPISYEQPKGMLKVRGEVLIERQIRQLQEAGIDDITVVVGYKREQFFYLEDRLGVRIVANPDYATRNNNSTIKVVEGLLGNTYICSSDDYFTENPFEEYVYRAYYSAAFEEGPTPEYCLSTRGKEDLIVDVAVGGENSWVMLGHAYWDRAFSEGFVRILNQEYDRADTAPKLWEDIYMEHLNELPMVMRKYQHGVIWEFDSLDELRQFDPAFIDNVDSSIMDNICSVLKCARKDISSIVPIKQGLTNLSCRFEVDGEAYVYRHPGTGTESIIDRAAEAQGEQIASKLGLDSTFIHEDSTDGWKLSRFLKECRELDYHDSEGVKRALGLIRTLHEADASVDSSFDLLEEAAKMERLLRERSVSMPKDFPDMKAAAARVNDIASRYAARRCLCHNDFYPPNILLHGDDMDLIDWEYCGMSDYASDLGVFICCCPDYSYDDARSVISWYFGRKPSPEEMLHCVSMIAVASFYWFLWALYREACDEPVGDFLHLWYRCAKEYADRSFALAEELEG